MNHIDSAIKARGANRTLAETFGASKPVPGTYDDILLSDAFITGKNNPENRRSRDDESSKDDYLLGSSYVDYYFDLTNQDAAEEEGLPDLLFTSCMFGAYETILCGTPDGQVEGTPVCASSLMLVSLAGAFQPPQRSVRGHQPMLRMRRCRRNGTVSYTVV